MTDVTAFSPGLLSLALDEVYALRNACAFEAHTNETTLALKNPQKVVDLLNSLNRDYLLPAARGLATDLDISVRLPMPRWQWEAMATKSAAAPMPGSDQERLYESALEEIRALRKVAKRAQSVLPTVLLSKSLPRSRRGIVEQQIGRMRQCVAGRYLDAYNGFGYQIMERSLNHFGLPTTLTAGSYQAEQEARVDR